MGLIEKFRKISSSIENDLQYTYHLSRAKKIDKWVFERKAPLANWIFIFLLLLFTQPLASQTHTTYKNYSGNWESPESWNPRWDNPSKDLENKDIVIYGFIKCKSNLKLIRNTKLIVEENDTLVIEGNLELEVGADIEVEKGAILIVMGSLVVRRPAKDIFIHENAYLVVAGKVDVLPSGQLDKFESDDDLPKLFVGGEIKGPSGITNDHNHYSALSCVDSENRYPNTNCTYGNFDDFANDPLYPFYESLLNDDFAVIITHPNDVVICQGNVAQFTIEVEDVIKYQWEVNDGNGFENVVNETNISGAQSSTLTLSNVPSGYNGYNYRCKVTGGDNNDILSNSASLNVSQQVTANAGSDATICQSIPFTVQDASVQNGNGDYLWYHGGNGTISNATTLTPTYTPHTNDVGKTIRLTFTAQGKAGCASATDQMSLKVEGRATVDAGGDAAICENNSYTVSGATIDNGNGTFNWTHDGQGTLTEANTLSPTYTPDTDDAGQTITLTLTAQGKAGCASATDYINIRVDEKVNGSICPDDEICGNTYLLSGTSNGGTHIWSQANGPSEAKFSPRNDMDTPNVMVSEPGVYTFKLVLSNGQCKEELSTSIYFKEIPKAKIEAEDRVCGLEQVISASPNNTPGHWQVVSGSEGASFDKNNERHHNKLEVKETGIYELSWIANMDGCMDTAYQVIRFNQVPKANAGLDKELFYKREAVLDASLQNEETGYWNIIKGFGLFDDKHLPTTRVTNLSAGENIFEWVVNNGLCESKNIVVINVSDAQVPNIITPNGDSKNDYLIIKDIQNMGPIKLVIFNRWGNKVFQSNKYVNNWDGRDMNGNELAEDTYYYYLEFTNKKVIKGYVLIQR